MSTIFVARSELFEKLWSAPMKDVAVSYDCDYWRLRNACLEADIPIPPKGYWMKVAHGKPLPARPPLPGTPKSNIALNVGYSEQQTRLSHLRQTRKSIGYIAVPEKLRNVHPSVAEIMRDRPFWSSNPQLNAILSSPPNDCVRRSYRIADVIAWEAEKRGFTVTSTDDRMGLAISSEYRVTPIRIRERLPKPGESIRGKFAFGLKRTGLLEIQIHRSRWAAEPKDDIVALLPNLIALLEVDRDSDAKSNAEAEERRRKAQIRAAERAAVAERARQDTAAFDAFLGMARRYREAGEARALLDEIEAAISDRSLFTVLEWLRSRVISHDPMTEGADEVLRIISSVKDGTDQG
jgi:hypothetical protein